MFVCVCAVHSIAINRYIWSLILFRMEMVMHSISIDSNKILRKLHKEKVIAVVVGIAVDWKRNVCFSSSSSWSTTHKDYD